MIRFLLLARIDWTDSHQTAVIAAIAAFVLILATVMS